MRILIVGEYIAPLQAVASIRWTKIAKYIKKSHPESSIAVLTNQKYYENVPRGLSPQKKDPMLEKDMGTFDEYLQFPSGWIAGLYEKIKTLKGGKIRRYVQMNKYTQISGVKTNIKKALFAAALDLRDCGIYFRAKSELRRISENYDVVISSYGPSWPHRAAAYIKHRNPHVRWVADYRDPYASNLQDPISFHRHQQFTMKCCACADYIVRVAEDLQTYTPKAIPILTIPNGYDSSERLPPKPPEKFSIVFTGVLYGEMRDIGIVCKALGELCNEQRVKREDVEIAYAGPDGVLALELAGKYAARDFLHNYGMLPRKEALVIQQHAAILLQLNWNTQNEKCGWSGKMYEYMMAQKPILYVVTGDVPYSAPSGNIHYLDGCCYEQCRHEETYPQMKAYILGKYQEWKATGNVSVRQDREYIEKYSYAYISQRVWELIACDNN